MKCRCGNEATKVWGKKRVCSDCYKKALAKAVGKIDKAQQKLNEALVELEQNSNGLYETLLSDSILVRNIVALSEELGMDYERDENYEKFANPNNRCYKLYLDRKRYMFDVVRERKKDDAV